MASAGPGKNEGGAAPEEGGSGAGRPWAPPAGPSAAGGGAPQPQPPPHFCCPVSMDLMQDPVMIATGHTYDRPSITRWLAQGHRTCPSTGMRLRHLELVPNFALRSAITARCRPLRA